jgi:tetratricopeptide (TPR) repeat protein
LKVKNKLVRRLTLLAFLAGALPAYGEEFPIIQQYSADDANVFMAVERLPEDSDISLESAYVRARAAAWLRVLDKAAAKPPARYDFRFSEFSRNDKIALAAQTYVTTVQPPEPRADLPHVAVILQPRQNPPDDITLALQKPELLRFWNNVLEEIRAILQEQSAGDPAGRRLDKPDETALLKGIWLVRDAVVPTGKGMLVKAESLPLLEEAVRLAPRSPAARLALAEAQLQQDLPEQCLQSCDQTLNLAPGLYRARFIRALALMSLRRLALAENDLSALIAADLPLSDKEMAGHLRTRGAVRLLRGKHKAMCEDFSAACGLGDCDGLTEVRSQGHCDNSKALP